MKILITFYALNDLGGIINNQEGLYAGLTALGHEVTVRELHWKTSVKPFHGDRRESKSEMGVTFNQRGGWAGLPRFAYKGPSNIRLWKDFASKFDLIIWQIPVPTKQKDNFGNQDWLELYDVPVKQIAYVHDGNLELGSPHIYAIMKHLTGVTGVHPCAYHALAKVPLPRAMTFSSQMNIESRLKPLAASFGSDRKGFLSLQTFKGWKHVDDLVRTIPYTSAGPKQIAGGGIQYYYMTSEDKTKEAYRVNLKADPDASAHDIGRRIWDVALDHGMEYLGYVTNEQREFLLGERALLVDPSWSKRYAAVGDHFNRVVIDGLIAGAAPVARNLGVSTNEEGNGELFKAGENYLMVPHDVKPREFGELLTEWEQDKVLRQRIVEAGRLLLPHFDYRRVAQAFIDLANGQPAGYYQNVSVGSYDQRMQDRCDELMNGFFAGVKTKKAEEPEEE